MTSLENEKRGKIKALEECQARISQLERQLKAKEHQANESRLHFRSQLEHSKTSALADFSVKGNRENCSAECYEADPVKSKFPSIQSSIGCDKWETRRRKGGGSDVESGAGCRGKTGAGGGKEEEEENGGAGGGQGDEREDDRSEGKTSLLRSSEDDDDDDGRLYSKRRMCKRRGHKDKDSTPDSDETFNFHGTPGINDEPDCSSPIRICEISSTGNYIRLRNTTSQERNIGGHYIVQRRDDGGPFLVFRFPSSVPVAPKGTVTVWSGSTEEEAGLFGGGGGPPTDYVFTERQSWLTGSDCRTVLCRPDEHALSWLTALGPTCGRAKDRGPLAAGSGEPKLKPGDQAQKEEEEQQQRRWPCRGDWSTQTKTPTRSGSSNPTPGSRSRSKSRSRTKTFPVTTTTKTKKRQTKNSTSNSDEEEEEEEEKEKEEVKEREEEGGKKELPAEDGWWGDRKTSLDKFIPCPYVHLEDGNQRREDRSSVRTDRHRCAVLEYSDSYCPAAASQATKTSGEDRGLEGKNTSKRCESWHLKDRYAKTMQQVCAGKGSKTRTAGKDPDPCPARKREQFFLGCNNSSRNLDTTRPRETSNSRDNSDGRLRGPRDPVVEESGRGWFDRWFNKGRPTPMDSKQTEDDNGAGLCEKRSQSQYRCFLPCEQQRGPGPKADYCVTEPDVRACRSEGDVRGVKGCSRCGGRGNDDPASCHRHHNNYPPAIALCVAAGLIVAVYYRQASK